MLSRIDHMLGHKTSLNKFKKIRIISNIFSDHDSMKIEINYKKKTERHTQTKSKGMEKDISCKWKRKISI